MQGRAGAGCGRNSTPRRKAAKTQSDFFYYETRKPGIMEKNSWFPGFLMELFLVAPLRLCGFALNVFCMVAGCKDWPSARTGAGFGKLVLTLALTFYPLPQERK